MHVIKSSIPSTIPLNTPNTIQTPSPLVDALLVSYAMLLISNGSMSCLLCTLVIHDIIHNKNYVTHVFLCSKHLWFRSQVHPSFIFLHPLVFRSCSSFSYYGPIPSGRH